MKVLENAFPISEAFCQMVSRHNVVKIMLTASPRHCQAKENRQLQTNISPPPSFSEITLFYLPPKTQGNQMGTYLYHLYNKEECKVPQ